MATPSDKIIPFAGLPAQPFPSVPEAYTSIFKKPVIISKADLCDILRLDPDLNHSKEDIERAARKRLVRLHPDIQNRYPTPLPESLAKILREEVTIAKEHMINQEWDFPTDTFISSSQSKDKLTLASLIKLLSKGSANTISVISSLSYLSNSFVILPTLSFFYKDHLLIAQLSGLKNLIDAVKPFANIVNGEEVETFLIALREFIDEKNLAKLEQYREHFPEEFLDDESWQDILKAVEESGMELKKQLSDQNIANIKSVFTFWPKFINTFPSYSQLFGVYSIAMLFSARTLPHSLMTYLDICSVIYHHKGISHLVATAIPFLALHLALMPIKIALLLLQQASYIALTSGLKFLAESIYFVNNTVSLVTGIFFKQQINYPQIAFNYFSCMLNLVATLPITVGMQLLDSAIFLLSGKSPVTPYINQFNSLVKRFLIKLNPNPTLADSNEEEIKATPPETVPAQDCQSTPTKHQPNFFKQPAHTGYTDSDPWFDKALNHVTYYQQEQPSMPTNAHSPVAI